MYVEQVFAMFPDFFFFFLLRVEKYGGICRVRYGR